MPPLSWTIITIFLAILYLYIVISSSNLQSRTSENRPVVALILARGGSKGIKLKNLAKINNITLLARSIATIKESGRFSKVWVSTDNEAISKEALLHGARVHNRAPHTATDHATSLSAVQDFLTSHSSDVWMLGLVQVTSPLLQSQYLVTAVDMMLTGNYRSVFSVTRQHRLRWTNHSGEFEADNFDPLNRPRRQDWSGELVENGMFYLAQADHIIKYKTLQPPRIGVVEIPNEKSLEIDTPLDLTFAQLLIEKGI